MSQNLDKIQNPNLVKKFSCMSLNTFLTSHARGLYQNPESKSTSIGHNISLPLSRHSLNLTSCEARHPKRSVNKEFHGGKKKPKIMMYHVNEKSRVK